MKKLYTIILIAFFTYSCSKDDSIDTILTATVKITATNNIVSEPSANGLFTLSLTNEVDEITIVNLTISGTAVNGTDYISIDNNIIIPAHTSSVVIPINVLDDSLLEETEIITITINSTNNSNVYVGTPKSASISIMDNTGVFVLKPEETTSYMVNPNATPETIALFYNLKILSKTKFIIGQHNAFNSFYNDNSGDSDIKKTTGYDPGLLGSDFLFITDDNNDGTAQNWFYQQEQRIKSDVVKAYNKGMVNVFTWHLREPYNGAEFYTANMTDFQKNNAFKSILPGGENHDYYKLKLQKVADVAKSMVGVDGNLVPFIFRPFHEFDGSWFWWGVAYCTPQEYKTLWQFTVEYLRDNLNVNNILFAFSPDNGFNSEAEYLERYPGDNYVDVLGMDNYGDFKNQGITGVNNANKKLQIVSKLSIDRIKISALSETGYFVTPGENSPINGFFATNLYGALTNNNIEIGFMMFWNNSQKTYCTPAPGLPDTADFIEFANKSKSALLNQLPNMYKLPL